MTSYLNTAINRYFIISAIFLGLLVSSNADTIVLRSGSEYKNVSILKQDTEKVTFRTENSTITIARSKIYDIKREDIGKIEMHLLRAKRMMQNDSYDGALLELQNARTFAPNHKEVLALYNEILTLKNKKEITKLDNAYIKAYEMDQNGSYEEAIRQYRILEKKVTAKRLPSLYMRIQQGLFRCHFEQAKLLINGPTMPPLKAQKALTLLHDALKFDNSNPELYFYLGKAEEFNEHIKDAKFYYQQAILLKENYFEAEEALKLLNMQNTIIPETEEKVNKQRETEKRIENAYENATKPKAPTTRYRPQKKPVQQQETVPPLISTDWKVYTQKNYWTNLLKNLLNFLEKFIVEVISILLFIFLYWVGPVLHFRKAAITSDSYMKYQKWVKLFGCLTYIAIIKDAIARRQGHKIDIEKRCAHCKNILTDLYAWSKYDFMHCPHCNQELPEPAYTAQEFLGLIAQDIAEKTGNMTKDQNLNDLIQSDTANYLVNAILSLAIDFRTTDIHVEPFQDNLRIRNRVDGVLYDLVNLPPSMHSAITSVIKIMSQLDIAEKRIPQDGKLKFTRKGIGYDVRVATAPTQYGEKAILRILCPKNVISSFEDLGMDMHELSMIRTATSRNYGIILATGPTGSGKTTSLYTILQNMNTGDKNIVTLEDPIEYEVAGINQMQVNHAAGFTFATGLRSILRQDPDIIMVGEIRDLETAEIAVNSALTGHLVLSTLHTIDAIGAINRLMEMGIDTSLFASALNIAIAQRLLRINCPHCRESYTPDPIHLDLLGIKNAAKDVIFKRGKGCDKCNGIGYLGRTGVFEILVASDEIKHLIEQKSPASTILEHARIKGMKTLKEKAILKVLNGITSVEEVVRVIGG